MVCKHREQLIVFFIIVLQDLLSEGLLFGVVSALDGSLDRVEAGFPGSHSWRSDFRSPDSDWATVRVALLDGNPSGVNRQFEFRVSEETHPVKPLHA